MKFNVTNPETGAGGAGGTPCVAWLSMESEASQRRGGTFDILFSFSNLNAEKKVWLIYWLTLD
jgi:hypothetical protein